MVKKSIRSRVLIIVDGIEISYRIVYTEWGVTHELENMGSMWMCCMQCESFRNSTLGNPNHWKLSPEDLTPQGGILSHYVWRMIPWDVQCYIVGKSKKEVMLRKERQVGRCRGGVRLWWDGDTMMGYNEKLAEGVAMSAEIVWLYWQEWCQWCVRSWERWMVHRSMRNDLRMVYQLYIIRGCLMLEDFLFFSHHLLYCIAEHACLSYSF